MAYPSSPLTTDSETKTPREFVPVCTIALERFSSFATKRKSGISTKNDLPPTEDRLELEPLYGSVVMMTRQIQPTKILCCVSPRVFQQAV